MAVVVGVILLFSLMRTAYQAHIETINNNLTVLTEIREQMGFEDDEVDIAPKIVGEKEIEIIDYIFYTIEDEGTMANAGFRRMDAIELSQEELVTLILQNQGSKITVPITRSGELMEINVVVPNLELSVDLETFEW